MSKRNPDWSRDELILALDLYLRHRPSPPGPSSEEVIALSQTLNRIGEVLGVRGNSLYRNPNGVSMKLMNFRRLDPLYTSEGKTGLRRGGKADQVIWDEFSSDPDHLSIVAKAIRDGLSDGYSEVSSMEDDHPEALEGRILSRLHHYRERQSKIVKEKKKRALALHGHLSCEACGFNYEALYGPHGSGFIECHHLQPLHTLPEAKRTNLEDLALLCANCHRMVHAGSRWLSLSELKQIVRAHAGELKPD